MERERDASAESLKRKIINGLLFSPPLVWYRIRRQSMVVATCDCLMISVEMFHCLTTYYTFNLKVVLIGYTLALFTD